MLRYDYQFQYVNKQGQTVFGAGIRFFEEPAREEDWEEVELETEERQQSETTDELYAMPGTVQVTKIHSPYKQLFLWHLQSFLAKFLT